VAETVDDPLDAATDDIVGVLTQRKKEAPARDPLDEAADEITATIQVYQPSPLEKVVVGAAEGLASMAEAPDLAIRALERIIPRETLLQQIPNIKAGAEWLAGVGKDLRDTTEAIAPARLRDQGFGSQLAYGAGSMAPLIASSALGGEIAPLLGGTARFGQLAATALSGAAQTSVPMFYEVLSSTVDAEHPQGNEDKAMIAAALGLGIGATEVVGVGSILSKLNRSTGGGLMRFLAATATEALEEGAQESMQQALQDAAITSLTPQEMSYLERLESAGRAGLLGLVLGGIVGGGAHGIHAGLSEAGRKLSDVQGGAEGAPEEVLPAVRESAAEGSGAQRAAEGRAVRGMPAAERSAKAVALSPVQPEEAGGGAATLRQDSGGQAASAGPVEGQGRDSGGTLGEAAVRDVRSEGGSAPRGLQQAAGGQVAVPRSPQGAPLSYQASSAEARGSSLQPGDTVSETRYVPIGQPQKVASYKPEESKVRSLMEAMQRGEALPPILVSDGPAGKMTVDDGGHRLEAARRLGYESVPVRIINPKSEAAPAPQIRTADVVSALRNLVQDFDVGEGDELPASIQAAERVLDQRRAANIPPTELDAHLRELVNIGRIAEPLEIDSPQEQAQTAYTEAALKKAHALLDAFDAAKAEATQGRRTGEGEKPKPPVTVEEASDRILRGEHLSVEELQAVPKAIRRASERAQRGEQPHARKTPPAPQREKATPAASAAPSEAVERPLGTAAGAGGLQSEAAKPKRAGNVRTVTPTESLGDLAETEPFRTQGLGALDVPAQREVLARVFEVGQNPEVAQAIVGALPVHVVNELGGQQLAAERLFNDQAVFEDLMRPGPHAPVSIGSSVADAAVRVLARKRAEQTLGATQPAGLLVDAPSAVGAINDRHAATITVENQIREFSAFPGGLLDPVTRAAKKLIERFRRTPPLQDGAAPIPSASWTQRAVAKYADYFEPVARVERALAGESRPGQANLPDLEDAYLQETLRRGRSKLALDQLEAQHQKPILQLMRRARISAAEADAFVMARAAMEGNELVRSRNPENPELTRYGMTDEEAQAVLDEVAASPRAAAFEELGRRFDALNSETLDRYVATGRKTQEQIDALRAAQPHYAPARTDMSGPDGKPIQVPAGKKRVGQPFKKALGRESLAEHPIAFAFAQAEQAIVQGEINRTRQAFLSMVRAYQDQLGDTIKLVDTPMQRVLVNGEARESFDQNFRNRSDVVVAWENGKPQAIQIAPEHADLANALNQLGPNQIEGATRLASAFNRMRSALITRYRPFFWPFNMVRDVKSAAYLGSEFGVRHAARVVADVPRALVTLSGKQTELTPYVERYRQAGAPITFLGYSDLTKQLDRMQAELEDPKTSTGDQSIEGFRKIKEAMSTVSDIGENATRFSAFVHAIEDLGWSDERAASYAKELQNFERKGLYGNTVNAWYMFANAGVQASRRFAQAMRHPAIRRMMAISFVGAMSWDQLQRALGGKDEDGEDNWDKIPDYEKQGNFIFMYPDGSGRRVNIPAPFVFGAVNYTGQQLSALLSGDIGAGKFLASSTEAWVNAVNPLGSVSGSDGQGLLRALTPDIARLPLELATNRDWRGKPIYPEDYGSKSPDSSRSWPDVNPLAKQAAEFLNSSTGGDKYEPGAIDVSPETLEHVAYFFGAGLPQDILTVGQQARKLQAGESIPTRDIPLLKRIIREPSPFASWSEQEDLLYSLKAEQKRAADEKGQLSREASAALYAGEAISRERGKARKALDALPEKQKQAELQRLDIEAQRWNKRAREALKNATEPLAPLKRAEAR